MRVRLAVLSSTKKEINSPSASLAVKQSSYVRKCFRCFFLGMPSCNDFTMLFQSRVALQGPSSTKLLSMFYFLLVLFTFRKSPNYEFSKSKQVCQNTGRWLARQQRTPLWLAICISKFKTFITSWMTTSNDHWWLMFKFCFCSNQKIEFSER